MSVELWTEKYRPKTLDEYVWADASMRIRAEEWIAQGALPHLLLYGTSGLGKTSLALLMLKMLNIPQCDQLLINASRERKVDDLQDRIAAFVSTWAMGESGIKYVILDEADALTPMAQKVQRTDMETQSSTCRFILTANYPEKIIPAIRGRTIEVGFKNLDRMDFAVRCVEILQAENKEFDFETGLLPYIELTFPNMRQCLSLLQDNSLSGILKPLQSGQEAVKDYLVEMVGLFQQKRFQEARKLIVSQAQTEEFPDIYRYLYRNLNLFGSQQRQQDDAILILRRAIVDQVIVADQEILFSATMVELSRIT